MSLLFFFLLVVPSLRVADSYRIGVRMSRRDLLDAFVDQA